MRLLPLGITSVLSTLLLGTLLAGCNPSEEGPTTMRDSEPYDVGSDPDTSTQIDGTRQTEESMTLDDEDREDREPLGQ